MRLGGQVLAPGGGGLTGLGEIGKKLLGVPLVSTGKEAQDRWLGRQGPGLGSLTGVLEVR